MSDFKERFKGKTSSISRDGGIRETGRPSLPIQPRSKSGYCNAKKSINDYYDMNPLNKAINLSQVSSASDKNDSFTLYNSQLKTKHLQSDPYSVTPEIPDYSYLTNILPPKKTPKPLIRVSTKSELVGSNEHKYFRNVAYQQLTHPYTCNAPYPVMNQMKQQEKVAYSVQEHPPQYFINYNNNGYVINHLHGPVYEIPPMHCLKPVRREGQKGITPKKCRETESKKHKRSISMNADSKPYKPYTLKDYQVIKQARYEVKGGLGANIGTPDWNERKRKLDRMHEFAKSVQQINKWLFVDNAGKVSLPKRTLNIGERLKRNINLGNRKYRNWRLGRSEIVKASGGNVNSSYFGLL